MEKVKVWNDNRFDLRERFKGELVEIPAGKSIEMDWDEAVEFKGQYHPMEFDGAGNQKPESYKFVRIEGKPPHLLDVETDDHKCIVCNGKFGSSKELDAHVDAFHLDQMDDQKLAAKRRKTAAN